MEIQNGQDHPYWMLPQWKKRLYGFLVYQLCSWLSLFIPIKVEKATYKSLKDQFVDDDGKEFWE